MRENRRRNVGVTVLAIAAVGLSAASVAILAPRPDATHVVKEHLALTLAPQVGGLLMAALGLWVVSAHVFRSAPRPG